MHVYIKPNTHRRRQRDETVESRRVGVGGVYWALLYLRAELLIKNANRQTDRQTDRQTNRWLSEYF